jgi:hypothetical protein
MRVRSAQWISMYGLDSEDRASPKTRRGRLAFPRSANPLPLGPLALDEPSPIAGPTGSLNRERGMIGWISVALSHDLCAAKRAAHRNQIVTLVQFEHTLCSVALDCWTVVNLSGPVKTFRS